MDKGLRFRILICSIVAIFASFLLAPTIYTLIRPDQADKLPGWMPNTAMKLGLDLQGGIHLVMGVDLEKVVESQLTTYGRSLEKSLADKKLTVTSSVKSRGEVGAKSFELDIKLSNPADKAAVSDFIGTDFSVLEVIGDFENTIVARMSKAQEDYVRDNAIEQSILTIRNRIDEFGVAEPIIARKGDSQILIQFPGAKEPERLKGLIGQTAQLKFQIIHECQARGRNRSDAAECLGRQQATVAGWISEAEQTGNYKREDFKKLSEYKDRLNQDLKAKLPQDTEIAFERERDVNVVGSTVLRPYLLSTKNILSGEYIQNAFVTMSRQQGSVGPEMPVVSFEMNPVGAPMLSNLTTEFEGSYMAIVLDGIVRSAPVIQSPITGGSGQITLGAGNIEEMQLEARDTAIVLRAGALPASIELQEERVIGPSMGRDAIEAGKKGLVIAGILVFLFMWIYYGVPGLLSNIVTAVNVFLIFAFLGAVGATLTLPGIAGIVLTIGMAVDAIVIIFERMREEIRRGRPNSAIVNVSFDRAFSTILDSNITTAIGGFVLLQFGTGSIRGFALTLIIGIMVNIFMATFFARVVMETYLSLLRPELKMGMSRRETSELAASAGRT
jgi:preprotein translocase subunit SecD